MRKVAFAIAAAVAFSVAAVQPAQAVNMFWTYGAFTSVDDCLSRAARTVGAYGATDIQRGDNHILGAVEPDMLITVFCLPSPQGATGLLTVAADHAVSEDRVTAVRSELWRMFRAS